MKAFRTAFKLSELQASSFEELCASSYVELCASSWNCMEALGTACKPLELHAHVAHVIIVSAPVQRIGFLGFLDLV